MLIFQVSLTLEKSGRITGGLLKGLLRAAVTEKVDGRGPKSHFPTALEHARGLSCITKAPGFRPDREGFVPQLKPERRE